MSETTTRGWLVVPEQINKAAAIAFARVAIGVLWIFEVTVGHNWKLGGFGSGTNPGWVGPGAGDTVREEMAQAVDDGTWSWVAWVFENGIEPNAAAFSYLVIGLQVMFGLFFIFGFLVRPTALVALAMDLSIFFLGNSRIPPFFAAMHLFLLFTAAGRYYGADGWIMARTQATGRSAVRGLRWLIDLPLMKPSWTHPVLMAGTMVAALYFFLQIPMRDTGRMSLVAMELAFLFGLIAAGLYFGRLTTDRLGVVVALMRVFIGFKFLHEIWVRVEPGVNGLPGWADRSALEDLFAAIGDNHWAPFSWLADSVFEPAMWFWLPVFAVTQLAVGVALLVGYRTRLAALVGLTYLGGLGVMGFTRYAPFVYALLIVVLALDGGRRLGFDTKQATHREPRYGLPIHAAAVPVLVVLFAINFVVAAIAVVSTGGIAPDGYTESMGQMTTAMVAIFSGLFALIGWLQLRSGGPEEVLDGHGVTELVKDSASV